MAVKPGAPGVEAVRVEAFGTWGGDAEDAAAFMLDSGPGCYLLAQAGTERQKLAHRTLTNLLRAGLLGAARRSGVRRALTSISAS
ncbi:hypothetical protein [Streptomyces sp. NPDC019507]|uniref:hypothetical protein n=1 Tax=Streptomyces sp. NPDC019507 TaxID=3154689 RepID=UPI0033E712D2